MSGFTQQLAIVLDLAEAQVSTLEQDGSDVTAANDALAELRAWAANMFGNDWRDR